MAKCGHVATNWLPVAVSIRHERPHAEGVRLEFLHFGAP